MSSSDPSPDSGGGTNKGLRALIISVLVLLIGAGITVSVVDNGEDHNPTTPKRTVTIHLGGHAEQPAGVPAGPATLELGPDATKALEATKTADPGELGEDLANERPDGVAPATLLEGTAQQQALAKDDRLPDVTPLAAPFQAGCNTRLVGNYSSRNGVKPRLFVVHYTVSANRAGFADVNAITAYFNLAGSQASSNYVIDRDGNCNLIVRETSKAWTQATFNPVSISAELINTGSESPLMRPAGYRKLGRVIADAARRWRIPIRAGAISGCTVTRSGIVQHADLGACGGGHHDVKPFALAPVIAAARAAARPNPSSSAPPAVIRACRHVARHRLAERRGRTTPAARAHARAHLRDVKRRGWSCKLPRSTPARR